MPTTTSVSTVAYVLVGAVLIAWAYEANPKLGTPLLALIVIVMVGKILSANGG